MDMWNQQTYPVSDMTSEQRRLVLPQSSVAMIVWCVTMVVWSVTMGLGGWGRVNGRLQREKRFMEGRREQGTEERMGLCGWMKGK